MGEIHNSLSGIIRQLDHIEWLLIKKALWVKKQARDLHDFSRIKVILQHLGKPNEAWSIVGILNGRKTQTEVRLNIKIKEAKTNEIVSKRGIGSTQTNIQATGLQINEETEFGKSELGGALRKAIEDAILKH